jgi:hypothetical protein
MFRELDVVRISCLNCDNREFSGTKSVQRPPTIGDTGTIVHIYDPNDPEAPVVVEAVDSDGLTLWLADFSPHELELVKPYKES